MKNKTKHILVDLYLNNLFLFIFKKKQQFYSLFTNLAKLMKTRTMKRIISVIILVQTTIVITNQTIY